MGVIGARNLDLQVVVRHLQELKEVTLDILLPSLYHLQLYLSANILKGFCGVGKYKLAPELNFLNRYDWFSTQCGKYWKDGEYNILFTTLC